MRSISEALYRIHAADLGIWQYAVVAVILEAPAADFKYHSQLLVGIIAFPSPARVYCLYVFSPPCLKGFRATRKKVFHARVVFRCQQPDISIASHKHAILGC